jgi:hypothetical protein
MDLHGLETGTLTMLCWWTGLLTICSSLASFNLTAGAISALAYVFITWEYLD